MTVKVVVVKKQQESLPPPSPTKLRATSAPFSPGQSSRVSHPPGDMQHCIERIQEAARSLQSKISGKDFVFGCQFRPGYVEFGRKVILLSCQHGPVDPVGESLAYCEAVTFTSVEEVLTNCRVCGRVVSVLVPIFDHEIPLFLFFQTENESLAAKHLQEAVACIVNDDSEGALAAYRRAFLYTKQAGYYMIVPLLYEKLKKPEMALLAYLHQSLYLLQERRVPEAIQSLERCKENDLVKPGLDPVVTDLQLSLEQLQITPEHWADTALLMKHIPPPPKVVEDFLDGDCFLYPGKLRRATHIAVPLVRNITYSLGGSPVVAMSTVKTMDEFDKASGGKGCKQICGGALKSEMDTASTKAFQWIVITRYVMPNSEGLSADFQVALAEALGYRQPTALEVVTAMMWAAQQEQQTLYEHQQVCCSGSEPQIVVGEAAEGGLDVLQINVWKPRPGIPGVWVF